MVPWGAQLHSRELEDLEDRRRKQHSRFEIYITTIRRKITHSMLVTWDHPASPLTWIAVCDGSNTNSGIPRSFLTLAPLKLFPDLRAACALIN